MPLVTVVIPNFNHSQYLKQRISSVLDQTFQDFEVIILDDCSTDNSRDIIEHYRNHPKVSVIVYNETNSGSTFKQWKKGLELASGEYIWLAESDDYCTVDFLENAFNGLKGDSEAVVFFCNSDVVDSKNVFIWDLHYIIDKIKEYNWYLPFKALGKDFIKLALLQKNVIVNASAVLFKKESALKYINKVESYKMCGDWLFWGLMLLDGSIIYEPKKMNYFRLHDATTRTLDSYNKRAIYLIEQISVLNKLMKAIEYQNKKIVIPLWKELLITTSLNRLVLLNSLLKQYGVRKTSFFYFKFFIEKIRVIKRRLVNDTK